MLHVKGSLPVFVYKSVTMFRCVAQNHWCKLYTCGEYIFYCMFWYKRSTVIVCAILTLVLQISVLCYAR